VRVVDVSTGAVTSFGSGASLATQPCGCEVSSTSFCDYAAGDTGDCVACSGFTAASSCYLEDGLSAAGAADCARRCFGQGTFTTVWPWGRVVIFNVTAESGLFLVVFVVVVVVLPFQRARPEVDHLGAVLSTAATFDAPRGLAATADGKGLYVGGAFVLDYANLTGTKLL
jgi:hypothetical protein